MTTAKYILLLLSLFLLIACDNEKEQQAKKDRETEQKVEEEVTTIEFAETYKEWKTAENNLVKMGIPALKWLFEHKKNSKNAQVRVSCNAAIEKIFNDLFKQKGKEKEKQIAELKKRKLLKKYMEYLAGIYSVRGEKTKEISDAAREALKYDDKEALKFILFHLENQHHQERFKKWAAEILGEQPKKEVIDGLLKKLAEQDRLSQKYRLIALRSIVNRLKQQLKDEKLTDAAQKNLNTIKAAIGQYIKTVKDEELKKLAQDVLTGIG